MIVAEYGDDFFKLLKDNKKPWELSGCPRCGEKMLVVK
jgi:hypothetical protein